MDWYSFWMGVACTYAVSGAVLFVTLSTLFGGNRGE